MVTIRISFVCILQEIKRGHPTIAFPVMRCDDAAEKAGDAAYFITMDLDAGYWQVNMRKSARAKTAFYTPRGKKRFRSMPMGAKNAHPAFVAMVTNFEDTWDKLYIQRERKRDEAKANSDNNENTDMVDNWKKQREERIQHTHTSKPGSAVIVVAAITR